MSAPLEAKVQAGSLAAAVSGAAVWALQTYAFNGNSVPDGLVSLIYVIVPALLTFTAGYFAPHTPRPPATVTAPPSNVTVQPAPPA